MKSGWKKFWIVCAVAAGVGFVCCIAGVSMGATVSAMHNRFPNGISLIKGGSVSRNYDYGETSANADIAENFSGIHKISAEISAVSVQILPSDTKEVRLETEDIHPRLKFKYYVEDGELILETRKNISGLGHVKSGTIWIYLPSSGIEEVDMEIGAGNLYVKNLASDIFSLKVGAGEAYVEQFISRDLKLECGVGEITVSGTFKQEADISCGIGSINFTTAGKEADYNYDITCGIGEVNVGEGYYSGFGASRHIDNGMSKEMGIDCGIGDISVYFDESL